MNTLVVGDVVVSRDPEDDGATGVVIETWTGIYTGTVNYKIRWADGAVTTCLRRHVDRVLAARGAA